MNAKKILNPVTAGKKQGARTISPVTIRPFTVSDVDFVISRQLALYKSEYGFTSEIWNVYLTDGVHTFVKYFDPERDCMYILENEGVPSGCVAIAHMGTATAQLRFFFLEPAMRGRGAGHLLMDMAMSFCKERYYERVFLWTFSTLMAARHLYRSRGFRITDTHENTDWGEKILEERWDLTL
ncbi:GNAT family N-acetyltransferase [uncultured Methanoregula sp.]|uniref:GNAT family N-acetyltransferase n=1 Tax=uncultured Methanoregula sp. TaxID=1005933 RepID=UPI002AAC3710|nr:GNAT family N-acetyltransferase [uncultured Methanoregula sp.]